MGAMAAGAGTDITEATARDHDELFGAFREIVAAGEGFPQDPPLSRGEFEDYWIEHSSSVQVVHRRGELAGAYYVKPNYVGRAAHIANAGYFVRAGHRGAGIGTAMVAHSLRQARRLGFDALVFNLVFESNPARGLYRRQGFREVGRIPRAVEGEDAVIYWRSLEDIEP